MPDRGIDTSKGTVARESDMDRVEGPRQGGRREGTTSVLSYAVRSLFTGTYF